MDAAFEILVIDSGARSLRLACFENETLKKYDCIHFTKDEAAETGEQQFQVRMRALAKMLGDMEIDISDLSAVVARDGFLGRIQQGAYRIDEAMLDTVTLPENSHAAAMSVLLAHAIMQETGLPGYVYNGMNLSPKDEEQFYAEPPEIQVRAKMHILSSNVLLKREAKAIGKPPEACNFVIVHAGSVPTTTAYANGRIVCFHCNMIQAGTFFSLPIHREPLFEQPRDLSFSEKLKIIQQTGFVQAYLGTKDLNELDRRLAAGDPTARRCVEAMAAHLAGEAECAAAGLNGRVDRVIIFGELAQVGRFTQAIGRRTAHLAPLDVFPGTWEFYGLAEGALRVLRGEEYAREYKGIAFYQKKQRPNDMKVAFVSYAEYTGYFSYCAEQLADYDPVHIIYTGDDDALVDALNDVDGIIMWASIPLKPEVVRRLKTVKAISLTGTGANFDMAKAAAEEGIAVCAVQEYCTEESADHCCAMILALNRWLLRYSSQVQREHRWDPTAYAGSMERLAVQQLGILGLGRIGRAVARRMQAFGMRVAAYDPKVSRKAAEGLGIQMMSMEELLRTSDVITSHMPLGAGNQQLFDRATFAKMDRKPFFINCADGGLVDEAALLEALDSGQIKGAGLDVLAHEPPDLTGAYADFLGRDNVILTPHASFFSDTSSEMAKRIAINNLRYALNNEFDKTYCTVNGVTILRK